MTPKEAQHMSGPMTVGTGAMNQYGLLAQKHWRTWLPERYSTIPDPASFFSQLGTEVSDRIASVELDLLEPDDPTEEHLTRVGRRRMARLQAEELVLSEMVLLPTEGQSDSDEDSDEMPPEWTIPTAEQTAAAVIAEETE
jgi:hypothetical protein